MRVLLSGATGFVGRSILHAILEGGHTVLAPIRRPSERAEVPGVTWVEGDFMTSLDPRAWRDAVCGVDAVVNAVGIIRETRHLKFQELHSQAPRALFEAAQLAGVGRVIQISASGVAADTPFAYFNSKNEADEWLRRELPEASCILRPSLIIGDGGEATAQFKQLASLPVVPLIADGSFEFRPILVEELGRLVLEALRRTPMPTGVFEVGGAEVMSLKQVLLALRAHKRGETDLSRWEQGPVMKMPLFLMKSAALGGDIFGVGPMDSDMLAMLLESRAVTLPDLLGSFGFAPQGLRTALHSSLLEKDLS